MIKPKIILPSVVSEKPMDHLRSPLWPAFRAKMIAKHPFCAFCGYAKDLEGHHIAVFHEHPELELVESNVIILGEKCPTGPHHFLAGHLGNWSAFNPNVIEDAAAWLAKIHARRLN